MLVPLDTLVAWDPPEDDLRARMELHECVIAMQDQVSQPPLPRPLRGRADSVECKPAIRVDRHPREGALLRREGERLPKPNDLRVVHVIREWGDPSEVHAPRPAARWAATLVDVVEDDARAHPPGLVQGSVAVHARLRRVLLPRADRDLRIVGNRELV